MYRCIFRWGFVVVVALLIAVGGWTIVRNQQNRMVVLRDGTRVSYLGATYGRVHTITEWRLQWGLPPIQRVEHRYETKRDTLQLWFRSRGGVRMGADVARTADGRLCEPRPDIVWANGYAQQLDIIFVVEYQGLSADGQPVELEFHPRGSRFMEPPSDKPVARLKASMPRAPITLRIKQPEPLPATRRGKILTVRLKGFRWAHYEQRSTSAWAPRTNTETITATPVWGIMPAVGSLKPWKIVRAQYAPVGAAHPARMLKNLPDDNALSCPVEVVGRWNAPVYVFFVEFAHKISGRREAFEFYVPPPPVEQLRQRTRLELQVQKQS